MLIFTHQFYSWKVEQSATPDLQAELKFAALYWSDQVNTGVNTMLRNSKIPKIIPTDQ